MKKVFVFGSVFSVCLLLLMPFFPIVSVSNGAEEANSFNASLPATSLKSGADNETEYFALIAGCTEYENPRKNIPAPPLDTLPISSMKVVYEKLVQAPNWKEENIILLFNEDATKEGILSAFESLRGRIDDHDVFYFSWNGHGTFLNDTSGDEVDGFDEAICPYDADNDSSFITDDELEVLFDGIKADAQFLLFECCQSGGLVEGYNDSTKGILDVDGEGRVVVMLTPEGKNGLVGTFGWTMSLLFADAFSNESSDRNQDGWISAEEAFFQVDTLYPEMEEKLFLEIINMSKPSLGFQFLLLYLVLKLLQVQQIPRIIISLIWAMCYSRLFNHNQEFQVFLAHFFMNVAEQMGGKNDPHMCDEYAGELPLVQLC